MTKFALLLRNLRYFRGVNLAVVLGMAVATAVLTGALMVGDSVRGSLADLAIRRLGPVDYALFATRFFDQTLVERMGNVTPAIIVRGGAQNASVGGENPPRTADVQIAAVGETPASSAPLIFSGLPAAHGQSIVNRELAAGVAVDHPGLSVLLDVPKNSDAPRESALARRARDDLFEQLRTTVQQVDARDDFVSLFNPNPSQRVPRNAWVNLGDLQDAIEQPGRVNALFAGAKDPHENAADASAALNDKLKRVLRTRTGPSDHAALGYYGLTIAPVGNDEASLFARDTYIAPPVVDAAKKAADALHIPLREVSVNLINSVSLLDRDTGAPPVRTASVGSEFPTEAGVVHVLRSSLGRDSRRTGPGDRKDSAITESPSEAHAKVIHYAVGAGISSLDETTLANSEIAINQWTADQLGARIGDKLAIDFYLRRPGGDLTDASKALPKDRLTFTIKTILPMTGLGADPKLPPNYKGLTDADSVADWDPPEGLTIDKTLVTKADEDYWHNWHAAPKLYLNFETAKKLWGGVYGDVTGLRVPAKDADGFETQLLKELKPESMGLVFRPIKAEQIAAASGGTDFSMFFVMFSFFLIVAAALLVAMLFRLNIEQRARQLGLMAAVGFAPRSLRRLALGEGIILALIGGIIGLGGAIGYTSLIMYGLRTWWIGAVGTTAMTLHIVPLTLIYGLVGSLFVAFFAILWAVWRVGRAQPARLLAGGWGMSIRRAGEGRWPRWIGIGCVVIGVILVAIALAGKISAEEGFSGGALLLCGVLFWLVSSLRPRRHDGVSFVGAGSLTRLGIRNATRHTARGVLSVGLIAFAAFTLITVAAMKQNGVKDPSDRNSETGGYKFIVTAGIPLTGDLNSIQGRKLLGFQDPNGAKADERKDGIMYEFIGFTMIRVWQGQDISCLNLTKPNSPTVLGLPDVMIERGGFIPADSIDKNVPFWNLLKSDQGDAIPVFADSDTQEYVLQIPIGATIAITDQLGVPRNLKLVGTIAHSIFQGQLLMSDGNFRKLFPAQSGFGMALIDVGEGKYLNTAASEAEFAQKLSSELGDYSVSVDTTSARLRTYQNVQNTYLETFQTLGALGLMLGTLGLSVVLVRTVIERRAELRMLASLGFTSAARVTLVLSENTFLLVLGLGCGALCAVIGILPAVFHESRPINVPYLIGTLAAVLIVGLVSSAIAVAISGVHVAPADLRRE